MKPNELAKAFSSYIEEGTTPKSVKIQSFFAHLTPAEKQLLAKNISKAYASFLEEEKEMAEMRKEKRKEINELKKKAKELGLILTEA